MHLKVYLVLGTLNVSLTMVIFKAIYTIYAWTAWVLIGFWAFLWALLVSIIRGKKGIAQIVTGYKVFAWVWCFVVGIRMKLKGREVRDKTDPCIIVSNHGSNLDMMTAPYVLKPKVSPLAKSELKKIPMLGYMFKAVSIFVDRKSAESEIKEERIISLNNKIELDNQREQKRVYLFTAIISILALLILSGVIITIIIYNKNQKKIAQEKIEQERLRTTMIIEAEEKERTRIAKDLHDSLGQMLAALKMNFNSLSINNSADGKFNKTAQILDDTIIEMRSISHAMMPESLVKNGLAKALMDISNHVEKNQTQVNVNVENWKGWNSTGEYVLYRIVQELLNNTLKHAQAKNVNIELNQFEDEINLIYEDDGKGFDVNSVKSDGIGLQNMNNRITSINGKIEFDSKPGVGTTAIISVPITN